MLTMKLIQKHLFKGSQEFEIIGDSVKICSRKPFHSKVERMVMLTVLNPEPVITKSSLEFSSRVNGEVLLSLRLAKPNEKAFNAFVVTLKQNASEAFQSFAGLKSASPSTVFDGGVVYAPPAFDEADDEQP